MPAGPARPGMHCISRPIPPEATGIHQNPLGIMPLPALTWHGELLFAWLTANMPISPLPPSETPLPGIPPPLTLPMLNVLNEIFTVEAVDATLKVDPWWQFPLRYGFYARPVHKRDEEKIVFEKVIGEGPAVELRYTAREDGFLSLQGVYWTAGGYLFVEELDTKMKTEALRQEEMTKQERQTEAGAPVRGEEQKNVKDADEKKSPSLPSAILEWFNTGSLSKDEKALVQCFFVNPKMTDEEIGINITQGKDWVKNTLSNLRNRAPGEVSLLLYRSPKWAKRALDKRKREGDEIIPEN